MNGRKYFLRNTRENVASAECRGNAEWAQAQQYVSYLGKGDKRDAWGGPSDCCAGGPVE